MGKKFKKGSGPEVSDVAVNKAEVKGDSSGILGLSSKSKKIKKQKKREADSKVLTAVPNSESKIPDAIAVTKQKKRENTLTETAPKIKVEQPVSGTPKKSKKHKKKKNKDHTNGTNPDDSRKEVGGKEVKAEGTGKEDALKVPKKHKKKDKRRAERAKAALLQTGTEIQPKVNGNETPPTKKHKKHKRKSSEVEPESVQQAPEKKHGKNLTTEVKSEPETKTHEKALEADRDVVTSESESDDDENAVQSEMDQANQLILKAENGDESSADEGQTKQKANGKKEQEVKEEKTAKRFTGPEHSIFIGNLPNTVKKSTMKSLFNQYGKILTIRFRSNDGITLFKKKDRKEAKALNCYIRFETKPEAQAACAMNGQLVEGNRIRVTMHMQKQMGHASSTVFVGNINRKTTDNELYDFFSRVGEIEYVRQIADKGIGYVCFKKGVSIAKALKMNEQMLNARPLRIMKVDPNKQGQRKNKKGNLVDKRRGGKPPTSDEKNRKQDGGPKPKAQAKDFHGSVAHNKMGKKKHKTNKKGGGDKKKKLLAQKLNAAASNSRNK